MARYAFDVYDGEHAAIDAEGLALDGIMSAHNETVRTCPRSHRSLCRTARNAAS